MLRYIIWLNKPSEGSNKWCHRSMSLRKTKTEYLDWKHVGRSFLQSSLWLIFILNRKHKGQVCHRDHLACVIKDGFLKSPGQSEQIKDNSITTEPRDTLDVYGFTWKTYLRNRQYNENNEKNMWKEVIMN